MSTFEQLHEIGERELEAGTHAELVLAFEGDGQVAIGDDVIVRGLLTKYGSIYETSSKKAYVYSLNGKTE